VPRSTKLVEGTAIARGAIDLGEAKHCLQLRIFMLRGAQGKRPFRVVWSECPCAIREVPVFNCVSN